MKEISKNPPDFTVRNSVVVLVIIGIVLLCMLATVFKYNTDLGDTGFYIVAALAPFFAFFIRKKVKTAIIRINRKGIIYEGKLITDWKHFRTAKTDQETLDLLDPRDKVVLKIYFFRDESNQLYEYKLRLHNTYNKSEEQILAAIELFRNLK